MSDFVPRGGGGGGRQPWRGRGNRNWRGGPRGQFHRGGGRRGGRNHGRGFRGGGGGGRAGGRGRGGRGRGPFGGGREIFEEIGSPSESSVSIAVEGCCHGELDSIYERIKMYEEKGGKKIDLLICCGDFQSIRHPVDFHSFAAPPKYRTLGSFSQYYSGAKKAPILTIFVGGNHENSQQLQELFYGGWVAPNIYYMGAAGVVNYKGVRIGGISGIYKEQHYKLGHFERPPYNNSTLRSVYHVRMLEVFRLKCLKEERRCDVMVSHDWPQGIENHGNTRYLLTRKPFFRDEVERNCLGSPANNEVLQALKPKLWFAAHLHVGFKATVNFAGKNENSSDAVVTGLVPSQVKQEGLAVDKEKIQGASGSENNDKGNETVRPPQVDVCQPVSTPEQIEQSTKFISLDKCLPGRNFLAIAHVEPPHRTTKTAESEAQLEYDPEWLAILRKTHQLTDNSNRRRQLPDAHMTVSSDEVEWINQQLENTKVSQVGNALSIPNNFSITVPPAPTGVQHFKNLPRPLPMMGNPQTDDFLNLLGLDHIVTVPYDPNCLVGQDFNMTGNNSQPQQPGQEDDNEIDIDDALEDGAEQVTNQMKDENEIDIDEGGEASPDDKAMPDKNEIDIDEESDAGREQIPEDNAPSEASQSPKGTDPKRPRTGSK